MLLIKDCASRRRLPGLRLALLSDDYRPYLADEPLEKWQSLRRIHAGGSQQTYCNAEQEGPQEIKDSIDGLSFYALRATVCCYSRTMLSQQVLPLKQKAGPEPNG